jgi:predicted RNA-binding Zn-ribbon protein involved in translation (DUF1610 family)
VLIFYVMLGLVLVRFVALLAAVVVLARPVRSCPACFEPATAAVTTWWLTPLRASMEIRWCPQCGWQGIARKQRKRLPTSRT